MNTHTYRKHASSIITYIGLCVRGHMDGSKNYLYSCIERARECNENLYCLFIYSVRLYSHISTNNSFICKHVMQNSTTFG